MPTIGLRRETKSPWERRTALTPPLAQALVTAGHQVLVERCARRVFSEAEYVAAGCTLVETLPACQVVFGVKEVPGELLVPAAAHLFFAHVIKAQPYNMGMLQQIREVGATLLDYERICDAAGRRLVFFGRFAGLAGMIDTLWTFGQRLVHEGQTETPFAAIKPAHAYAGLEEACAAVRALGETIRREGVPAALHPLVIGVTGNGNVARGVQEVLAFLPCEEVSPDDLADLVARGSETSDRCVYRVTFSEEHLAARQDGGPFVLQDYYDHPEQFEGTFARYHPHLSMLLNCIYWTDAYPRLVYKRELPDLVRCKVIGDISCDVGGSIEATLLATEPGDPVYTYDPTTDAPRMGVAGPGPVICAVDILPAELPRDASEAFAAALEPFALGIAGASYQGSLAESGLPEPMQRSCIVWRGELTPEYAYLAEHLPE